MLDEVVIFRKSGIVLWKHTWVELKGTPVNLLIHQVLLEVRMRRVHARRRRAIAAPFHLSRLLRPLGRRSAWAR